MYVSIRNTIRSQRGDTLVEVLIAMAVISMILGGAYVTTNRSLLATRAAQERSIALKLAESQLEQLKGLVEDPATAGQILPAGPNPFCINSAGQPVTASNAACVVNASGAQAAAGTQPAFTISIARVNNEFTVTETWTNVSGRVTDNLKLKYRVYEP